MIEELLRIFPNAQLNPPALDQLQDFIVIEGTSGPLYIPTVKLDLTHQALLKLVAQMEQKAGETQLNSYQQQWLDNLTKGLSNKTPDTHYQLFYLYSKIAINQFDFSLWQATLLNAVPEIKVIIPLTSQQILIVLESPSLFNYTDTLNHILAALNIDFGLAIKGMAGLCHHKQTLHHWYKHELSFSQATTQYSFPQTLCTVSQMLLASHKINNLFQHELARYIAQLLQINSEFPLTIQALFANNGKLSQTADQLYIHRNTLNNRLQRLYRETGLDVQNLADLTVAYLLL